jgi:hypothetical protein
MFGIASRLHPRAFCGGRVLGLGTQRAGTTFTVLD